MRKDPFFTINPIICTLVLFILLFTFFLGQHLIQIKPSPLASFGTYGEVIAIEKHGTDILVTINHLGGPSEYSGTQQYLIDSSTTISNSDRDVLMGGSIGMLVWVKTNPFKKSDFSFSEEYVFSCEKFLIRQPTVPDWWIS